MEGDKITTISFIPSLRCLNGHFGSSMLLTFSDAKSMRIILDENENIHSHYLINGKDLLCSFVTKC